MAPRKIQGGEVRGQSKNGVLLLSRVATRIVNEAIHFCFSMAISPYFDARSATAVFS